MRLHPLLSKSEQQFCLHAPCLILKPDEEPDGGGSSIEVGELMLSNSGPVATRVGVGWGRLKKQCGASIGQWTVYHIADIFTLYQCEKQALSKLSLNSHCIVT